MLVHDSFAVWKQRVHESGLSSSRTIFHDENVICFDAPLGHRGGKLARHEFDRAKIEAACIRKMFATDAWHAIDDSADPTARARPGLERNQQVGKGCGRPSF